MAQKGLTGLGGFAELSEGDRQRFINRNRELIAKYHYDPAYINNLYDNTQFVKKFGIEAFRAQTNPELRDKIYKHAIVGEAFTKRYQNRDSKGKINNTLGLGNMFDYYNSRLSDDGKIKLLQSNYLLPEELEAQLKKEKESAPILAMPGSGMDIGTIEAMNSENLPIWRQNKREYNQRILDNIFDEDIKNRTDELIEPVQEELNKLSGLSPMQIEKEYLRIIKPNSYTDKDGNSNLGIPEFAVRYNGKGKYNSSEVEDMTLNEKMEFIAKKKAYDKYMPLDMAQRALNNEAKEYIVDHQGWFKRKSLQAKDLAVKTASYTADKIDGLAEIGRQTMDMMGNNYKPTVWVDDRGEVVDTTKAKFQKDQKGNWFYRASDGKNHYVHQEKISNSALHQMGKEEDGSDIKGAFGIDALTLNPKYWSRAEQFGTFDATLQEQYEKLGASPYQLVYKPGDDGDLLYESMSMASFAIADGLSMLIPYGIGWAGRSISKLSKLGKIGSGLGKALNATSKVLGNPTVNGLVGAEGIAFAYGRSTFLEDLQRNYADLDEAVSNKSEREVSERYAKDKEYKNYVDNLISKRTQEIINTYKINGRGNEVAAQGNLILIRNQAKEEVFNALISNKITENKASKEFGEAQQNAIDRSSDALRNVYLSEGVKYGLVNTLGPRKFLYKNHQSVINRASENFKNLIETVTKGGKKRLTIKLSKFLTSKQKWAEFGKTTASQAWGGLWTNGTDDMQADAAEQISHDSYSRYLQSYQNGEAQADTYSLADGVMSMLYGLKDSEGQSTTQRAALVGALGSLISFAPNFTNIASYFTKSGREAYKQNLRKKPKFDEQTHEILRDEKGNIVYEDMSKSENWRERLSFFISNGVLNTYYGKKQAERDAINHAAYVNALLDDYDDFKDVEQLIASNLAGENLATAGDQKTQRFLNALLGLRVLNNLGNSSKDPTSMSSVINHTKELIDKLSNLDTEKDAEKAEELEDFLKEYYATNPGEIQSREGYDEAIKTMSSNAKTLQKAAKAYDKALKNITKIEKERKMPIDPMVKTSLLIQQALHDHWNDRKDKMRSEINDISPDETTDYNLIIASLGGRKNALKAVKVYDQQLSEYNEDLSKQQEKVTTAEEALVKAKENVENAEKEEGQPNLLKAQEALKDAEATYNEAKAQSKFIQDYVTLTKEKKTSLEKGLSENNVEEKYNQNTTAIENRDKAQAELDNLKAKRDKKLEENGQPRKGQNDAVASLNAEIAKQEEQLQTLKEEAETNKETVISADDIRNSLDPVTRARMMRKDNRSLYSPEQQKEIEEAEKKLTMEDPDALQKIQDIALLTQRVKTSEDAFYRMASNPEAAAKALEMQNAIAIDNAYNIINHNNAESCVAILNKFLDTKKLTKAFKQDFVFRSLRKINSNLLDIIERENMLPKYNDALQAAKGWARVTEDIEAVIRLAPKDDAWKENALKNIDSIADASNSREELLANMEQAIDDTFGTQAAEDMDYILEGLKDLNYERNSTIIENREKRKQREAEEKAKREEEKKRKEEAAQAAAEKKAEEERLKREEEENKKASSNSEDSDFYVPTDEDVDNAQLTDIDLDGATTDDGTPTDTTSSEEPSNSKEPPKEESTKDNTVKEDSTNSNLGSSLDDFMSEDTGDTVENAGNIWTQTSTGDTMQVPLIVTKKGNTISFTVNGEPYALEVAPKDYVSSEEEIKGEVFRATSLEKKDDGWYLKGNYIGVEGTDEVKVTDSFSLDKTIKENQTEKEAELASNTPIPEDRIIEDNDGVGVMSPSFEDQIKDLQDKGESTVVLDTTADTINDIDTENEKVENANELTQEVSSGMAISRYDKEPLRDSGVLVLRKGKNDADSMNNFFSWMDAAGIKYQNIVDHELGRILALTPHAKVRYLAVNPQYNATNDVYMQSHLLLVLDYDNSINKNITDIHNEANGGVIEANGKKYLVIGVAGFGNKKTASEAKKALYYNLWSTKKGNTGLMIKRRVAYFKEHPNERFYVSEDLNTEVVPNSLIPGSRVKQSLTDEVLKEGEGRSITELLDSPERNPYKLQLENLIFAIQEKSKFLMSKLPDQPYMNPGNAEKNMGSVYVFVPASNGKLMPLKLMPTYYNELKENSSLKTDIDNLIEQLLSKNYSERVGAAVKLGQYLYLNSERDFFLTKEDSDLLTIVHKGIKIATFNVTNFDRKAFWTAIEKMNPMINITGNTITNAQALKSYAESGALRTDVALLGTAGSAYNIYGVDKEGKMVVSEHPNNSPNTGSGEANKGNLVIYDHFFYKEVDGNYSLNGVPVTDDVLIKQLQYNQRILNSGLEPVFKNATWDFFVLSMGEHPEVVKVNTNTKEVQEITGEPAQFYIDKYKKQLQDESREDNVKDSVEKEESNQDDSTIPSDENLTNIEDIDNIFSSDESISPDDADKNNTSTLEPETKEGEKEKKAEIKEETDTSTKEGEDDSISATTSSDNVSTKDSQTVGDLILNLDYSFKITSIISDKWGKSFNDMGELEAFLKEHKVPIDNIGTSEADINAWIKTLEECR